jgi:hypothetical protein
VGYVVWLTSRPATPEVTQAQATAPTTSNIQSQPVESPAPEISNSLDGVWEGEGYQTDTQTTWKVRLTVHDNEFAVEYPNIPCNGFWKVVDRNSSGGTFTEIITNGAQRCANNSHILMQKVSDSELSCKYSYGMSRKVIATAALSKK